MAKHREMLGKSAYSNGDACPRHASASAEPIAPATPYHVITLALAVTACHSADAERLARDLVTARVRAALDCVGVRVSVIQTYAARVAPQAAAAPPLRLTLAGHGEDRGVKPFAPTAAADGAYRRRPRWVRGGRP